MTILKALIIMGSVLIGVGLIILWEHHATRVVLISSKYFRSTARIDTYRLGKYSFLYQGVCLCMFHTEMRYHRGLVIAGLNAHLKACPIEIGINA